MAHIAFLAGDRRRLQAKTRIDGSSKPCVGTEAKRCRETEAGAAIPSGQTDGNSKRAALQVGSKREPRAASTETIVDFNERGTEDHS
jgi:hypothetical protein